MEFRKIIWFLMTFIAVTFGQNVSEYTNIDRHVTNTGENTIEYMTVEGDNIFNNRSIVGNANNEISLDEQRNLPDMNSILDCNYLELSTENITFITSPGFPHFYTFGLDIGCHLKGPTGRGIEVIVYEVSLDSTQNAYLLIKPGDELAPVDRAIIFTSQLEEVYKYWFHDANDLFIKFVSSTRGPTADQFRGFNMSVQYINEYIPRPDDSHDNETVIHIAPRDNYTVFLDGLTPREFMNVSQEFTQILADMAVNFTLLYDLTPGEFPMNETVHLRAITSCRLTWPSIDQCTAVTFSIPTFFNETDNHYELNVTQLQNMWATFGQTADVIRALDSLGLKEYVQPDSSRVLIWWLVCTGAVIIVMLFIAVIIAQYDYFGNYDSVEHYADTESEISKRKSSMYPAPHQDLPAMFHEGSQDMWTNDIYGDYEYDGMGHINNGFVKDGELFDLDSDEEIVMSLPDGPPNKPQLNREMDA